MIATMILKVSRKSIRSVLYWTSGFWGYLGVNFNYTHIYLDTNPKNGVRPGHLNCTETGLFPQNNHPNISLVTVVGRCCRQLLGYRVLVGVHQKIHTSKMASKCGPARLTALGNSLLCQVAPIEVLLLGCDQKRLAWPKKLRNWCQHTETPEVVCLSCYCYHIYIQCYMLYVTIYIYYVTI